MKSNNDILIYAHYFLPANNAGGPPKSLGNLIDATKDQLKFKVMCCDHEFKRPTEKFPGIQSGKWTEFEGRKVMYLADGWRSSVKLIFEGFHRSSKVAYFNSFFDIKYTILPILALAIFSTKKIIIAPRGEFSLGALVIKPRKKKFYLKFFGIFRFHKRVIWQASSLKEKADLENFWGAGIEIVLLPNFPDIKLPSLQTKTVKVPGKLRLVYLARIAKIKNLLELLQALQPITGHKIDLDIFGPIEDERYWKDCAGVINGLPENITVRYLGAVDSADVLNTIAAYDLYVLLTSGENFGHTIHEALSASVPVLISDQTPWRQLREKKAGWDLPLSDIERFTRVLEIAASWDDSQIKEQKKGAYNLACNYVGDMTRVEIAHKLFA
jgi:glycosyltransferase involved in cell wall biosynthesis